MIGALLDDSPSSSTAKTSGYTYDDITVPATWCDNDEYVYEAKKVKSSYVVNTKNYIAILDKDTMTITDTKGNVQSVVSLNRWLSGD